MTHYQTATLDAMEVETRLRAFLDDMVQRAGGRRVTVYRVARIMLDDLRGSLTSDVQQDRPPVEAIMRAVAAAHNQPFEVLRARDRTHPVAWCRHHALWEIRQRRPDLGLCNIGAWMDRFAHTTVLNSLRKFNAAIKDGRFNGERALVERALSC
ncbi:MAG: hypothetical protein ABFD85_16180 [Phycisphaerae bacterium]